MDSAAAVAVVVAVADVAMGILCCTFAQHTPQPAVVIITITITDTNSSTITITATNSSTVRSDTLQVWSFAHLSDDHHMLFATRMAATDER